MVIKQSSKRLCVVIVNYKTASLVLDCIDTLSGQLDQVLDHVVVVDNKSGGHDIELINNGLEQRGKSSLVTLVASAENKGFSAGNNLGIAAINAKYYLLTNSDTLFRKNAVIGLLQTIQQYPDAGIVSPRLEERDGQPQVSCFNFHTPISELIDSASTRFVTKIFEKYNVPQLIVDKTTMPQWTSFACVLIKREVFETVGYMDEGYFMYYEDVDFCRKATEAGFYIVNTPKACVVHLCGKSSDFNKKQQERKRLPLYYYHSRSRYFMRYYGVTGWYLGNMFWELGRGLSLVKEVLLKHKVSVPAQKYLDIWIKE